MQEMTLSYESIVNYFGEETIKGRYEYLHDKMQNYIQNRKLEESLSINEGVLHQAVMDYFADIYRLKEFHKMEHINKVKIAAYEVYWLCRRKPIQIERNVTNQKCVFANEGFLTTFIAYECLIPNETEPLDEKRNEEFLKFLRQVNYHLKYRNYDKQCLELMIYSFHTGKEMVITDNS